MSNRTHFEKMNALSSSVIGFEFEFYTNMLKGKAAEALGKLLNKKVVVSEKYHSKVPVDGNTFKLEPDYSGGGKMVEFITGPLPYNEAITIMIKTLNWIDENGWTNDRCAFQFSVSFDKFRPDVKDKIQNMRAHRSYWICFPANSDFGMGNGMLDKCCLVCSSNQ